MGECFKFGRGKVVLYDPVFANNSWEKIISACQAGKVPSTWKVGDQKAMTINGTDYPIDIIGINHDTYSDGSGTAPLTFQMHDCYGTTFKMNSSNTTANSWRGSAMRTTHLPSIMALMPSEVQAGLKEVNKVTTKGSGATTATETTADKLFLLSYIEVLTTTSNGYRLEGTQYAYYANGNSKNKKVNGNVEKWWLRSPVTGSETSYWHVTAQNSLGNYNASSSYGVAFAFCF